ncbi:MAG: hypothetical protein K9I29_08605 [Bacteroidales bacterium]|nr:hypothetical protein [Bacteroidales bacterium]MCF8328343.1 hypothetical protein [Bacteroidales bacterium]
MLRIIEEDISQETPDRVGNPVRGGKVAEPSRHFSNLFNSYAQAFNKKHETQGALFERPFKRKQINDETYLRQVILYIHNNPVYHGFCKQPGDYLWSSYRSCISLKPTKLHRKAVIGLFEDVSNFKYMHQQKLDVMQIEKWLEISYL